MRIPIQNATDAQLRKFCQLQNLAFDGRTSVNKLLALLEQSGYDKDYIEIPDEEDRAVAAAPAKAGRKYVEITISSQEGETDRVSVGVNGEIMLIPRGRRCKIPYEYYKVLDDAKRDTYAESDDGLGEPISNHAYPFTVHAFLDA